MTIKDKLKIDDKSNIIKILMLLFAISSFISIAVGNVFLVLIMLYLFNHLHKKQLLFCSAYKGYFVAVGIFISAMLISALGSDDIAYGLKRWADMWIWRFMPFVAVCFLIQNTIDAKKIIVAVFIGFVIVSLYAIYQGVVLELDRANGLRGHPMTLAAWMCMLLPLFLIEFFEKRLLDKYYWLAGIGFCLCSAGLVFNATRGAWLAVAVVCALLLLYYMFKSKSNFIIGLAFVILTTVCLMNYQPFMQRLDTIDDLEKYQSNTERLLIWQSAWNMFEDHPVLGVGLGQYTKNYQQKYISPEAKEPNLTHAHNNFMQMLAENGIVGFAGFVIMFGYIIFKNLILWLKTQNTYALMIVAATLCLLLQGLTEYNMENSDVVKIYWLLLGLLVVLDNKSINE